MEALFDSDGWGGEDEEVRVAEVWEAIEAVMSRAELRAALVLVNESVPPADAADPDDWRTELVGRYTTVSGFLKVLPGVIAFGANAEGVPVLEAMKALPDVLAYRSRLPAPLVPGRLIDAGVVNGPWKRLVFGHPVRDDGSVNRHAYAFCVLERFWRGLKRREIYAGASTRWRNPQAELLDGAAVGGGPARSADHARPARGPGRAAGRALPHAGRRPTGRSADAWPPTPTSGWTTQGRST